MCIIQVLFPQYIRIQQCRSREFFYKKSKAPKTVTVTNDMVCTKKSTMETKLTPKTSKRITLVMMKIRDLVL